MKKYNSLLHSYIITKDHMCKLKVLWFYIL